MLEKESHKKQEAFLVEINKNLLSHEKSRFLPNYSSLLNQHVGSMSVPSNTFVSAS